MQCRRRRSRLSASADQGRGSRGNREVPPRTRDEGTGGSLSGHSKWSSITHKKGAADAKRGKLFSKLSRAIIVAAKEGGPDPSGNLALQNAIEKARSYSMPKDNIDRAIAKGSGAEADGSQFVTVDGSSYQVLSAPENLATVREAVESAGFAIDSAELTMLPKTTVEVIDESDAKKVLRLMDQLEDNDDVQDVYANFGIPERVLEAVAG